MVATLQACNVALPGPLPFSLRVDWLRSSTPRLAGADGCICARIRLLDEFRSALIGALHHLRLHHNFIGLARI